MFATPKAHVVKLVDTSDLGSDAARCGGSSPSMRTNKRPKRWIILQDGSPFYFIAAGETGKFIPTVCLASAAPGIDAFCIK